MSIASAPGAPSQPPVSPRDEAPPSQAHGPPSRAPLSQHPRSQRWGVRARAVVPARHRLVIPLAAVYAAAIFAWCFLRHKNFGSSAFELGAYHSVLWNVAYRGTPWNSLERAHQWSTHLELGLLPLVPLYRIAPSPAWLWLAEGITCGAAALPIDALARRVTGDATVGLLAAAAMLVTPQLVLGQVADFQPIALAILPVAVIAWSIEVDSSRGLALGSLAAILLREQLGVVVAVAAALWVLRQGMRRAPPAVALGVVAIAITAIELKVILPWFGSDQSAHYAVQYGGGVNELAHQAATHPVALLALAFEKNRRLYVAGLASGALPLVFLALRSLRASAWPLLLGVSPLAVQLLSAEPRKWDLHYPYGVPIVAAFAATAVLGLRFVPAGAFRGVAFRRLAAGAWIALGLAHLAVVLPSPVGVGRAIDPTFAGSPRAGALERAIALVPPDASISAQDDVVPHVAARSEVHRWPDGNETDEYVLLDLDGAAANLRSRTYLVAEAHRLHADPDFEVLIDQAGVVLAKRTLR